MDSQERQIKKERMVKIKAAGAEISFNPLMMSFGIFFFSNFRKLPPEQQMILYNRLSDSALDEWVKVYL